MKTTVCVIGQARMAEVTWDRFKKYVLDELNADLVLCVHVDDSTDRENPYFKNAKRVIEYRETTGCWSKAYDAMNPAWRSLVEIPGDWIGNIKDPVERKGSGGVLIFLRWFLYQNMQDFGDRLVVTRADYFWTAPHPTLDNDHIWLVNAEFHGGIPDRHYVIPAKHIKDVLTIGQMENPVATGNHMIQLMNQRLQEGWGHFMYNEESFTFLRYIERGILEKVGFFPMCMFLVDNTSHTIHPEFGVRIRYPTELVSSRDTVTWPFSLEHTYIQNGNFVGRSHPTRMG